MLKRHLEGDLDAHPSLETAPAGRWPRLRAAGRWIGDSARAHPVRTASFALAALGAAIGAVILATRARRRT